jgi:predicted transcriptional regulator
MGLYENIRNEPVSRLALRDPVVVSPEATVRDAVSCMRQRNLGCAIVVDQERKPVGLFAESMLTRLLSETPQAIYDQILDHIDKKWPTVCLSDPISCILSALEFANIRFLIVVDEQGRLAGLTGQKGLMEYVAEHFPRQVIVQRIGGKPYPAHREGA